MKKLIIQIPCFNEAGSIGATLADLPKSVTGIDKIEILIIDDGSTDDTVSVSKADGAHHVFSFPRNRGLARAFVAGLDESVRLGADIVVNTDADNQYKADDIATLVAPIIAGEAEIVVGARPISQIAHFSPLKRALQRLGSSVVRKASNTDVSDATSGFRAMTRDAAQQLNVFSDYTYTLETIIQAGQKGMAIISVPIRVNGETRPSRLITGITSYVWRSMVTIIRMSITYRLLRFFIWLGGLIFLVGFLIGARFLGFYLAGTGSGHIQSLILASMLMSMGFIVAVTGILADLISVNRKLLEQIAWRIKKIEEEQDTGRTKRASRFLARSLEVGGAEVQLSLLARNLDKARFEVKLFTLYERGTLLEELISAAIPVDGIAKQGRWDLIGPYRRLVEHLSAFSPGIVHSFLGPANIMAAAANPRLGNCRLVWGFRASNTDLTRYDWSHRVRSGRRIRIRCKASVSNFSVAAMVTAHADLYQDLVSRSGGSK